MFNLDRMKEAMKSSLHKIPARGSEQGITRVDFIRESILACGRNTNQVKCDNCGSDMQTSMKQSITKYEGDMKDETQATHETHETHNKEFVWGEGIMDLGGVSHFILKDCNKTTADGTPYKLKYRVALTGTQCGKKLKWRIKTASGEVFSVQSKTLGEAQHVVDTAYGKGKYRVSQMLA